MFLALFLCFAISAKATKRAWSHSSRQVSLCGGMPVGVIGYSVWGLIGLEVSLPDRTAEVVSELVTAEEGAALIQLRRSLHASLFDPTFDVDQLSRLQVQSYRVFRELAVPAVNYAVVPERFVAAVQLVVAGVEVWGDGEVVVGFGEYVEVVDGVLMFSPLKLYHLLLERSVEPPRPHQQVVGNDCQQASLPNEMWAIVFRLVFGDGLEVSFSSLRLVSRIFNDMAPLAMLANDVPVDCLIRYFKMTQTLTDSVQTAMALGLGLFAKLPDTTRAAFLHAQQVTMNNVIAPSYLHLILHHPRHIDPIHAALTHPVFTPALTRYLMRQYNLSQCKYAFFRRFAGLMTALVRLKAGEEEGWMVRAVLWSREVSGHLDAQFEDGLRNSRLESDQALRMFVLKAPRIFRLG